MENSGSSTTSHWSLDQREGSCQEGSVPAVECLELSLLIVHPPGPQCRPHSEIWKGGGFSHRHRTSIFFVLVLVQSRLVPRLYP